MPVLFIKPHEFYTTLQSKGKYWSESIDIVYIPSSKLKEIQQDTGKNNLCCNNHIEKTVQPLVKIV